MLPLHYSLIQELGYARNKSNKSPMFRFFNALTCRSLIHPLYSTIGRESRGTSLFAIIIFNISLLLLFLFFFFLQYIKLESAVSRTRSKRMRIICANDGSRVGSRCGAGRSRWEQLNESHVRIYITSKENKGRKTAHVYYYREYSSFAYEDSWWALIMKHQHMLVRLRGSISAMHRNNRVGVSLEILSLNLRKRQATVDSTWTSLRSF